MSSLLTIPREIRDQILELVIFSHRAPPKSPTEPPQERASLDNPRRFSSWSYGPENVKYDQQDIVPNSLSLLLVNRQLSAETKSTLERFPISYYLDVMIVNEQELHPTWLSVPAFSNRIDNVVVTFRIFGTREPGGRSMFIIGDGSPPQITWCFYNLMEVFLKCGPIANLKTGLRRKDVSINTLTLDFVSPPNAESDIASLLMRPDWLADFVNDYNHTLLQMSYHTAWYGMIMYERIGTIRYYVDGQLSTQHDLDVLLAKCRSNDSGDTFGNIANEERSAFFWKWKKKALKARKEAGLPVIYPDDPELVSDSTDLSDPS